MEREELQKHLFALFRAVFKQWGQSETREIPESLRFGEKSLQGHWVQPQLHHQNSDFPFICFSPQFFTCFVLEGDTIHWCSPSPGDLYIHLKMEEIVQWEKKNLSPVVVVVGLLLLLERIPKVLMLNKTFLQWPLLQGTGFRSEGPCKVIFPLPLGNENVSIWKGNFSLGAECVPSPAARDLQDLLEYLDSCDVLSHNSSVTLVRVWFQSDASGLTGRGQLSSCSAALTGAQNWEIHRRTGNSTGELGIPLENWEFHWSWKDLGLHF